MVVDHDEVGSDTAPATHAGGPDDAAGPVRRVPRLVPIVAALLLVPTVVAVSALAEPTWYAQEDFALIEMRVRDVTSAHPPLVGLAGRIEHDGVEGSHPGPLPFYLLAPAYRLFGSSGWAMQVGAALLTLLAVGTAVWIGRRRGGAVGALAVTTGMLTLLVAYGADRWATPWTPNLPLLWWPVVVLAAWSVLCRDWPMVVVFVGAASLCAQAHVSYLGLVGGLGILVAIAALRATWSTRSLTSAPGRWLLAGVALAVLLWAPPLLDEVRNDPGNLSLIAGQFLDPDDPVAGWGTAADITFGLFDPVTVVAGRDATTAASAGGVALVVAWLGAAALAAVGRARLPHDLLRLHLVVGAAAALGFVSVSRIQGAAYPYLTLWSWGTAVAMAGATAWTFWAWRSARGRGAAAVLLGAAAVALVVTTIDAGRARVVEQPDRLALYAAVLPEALDALAEGRVDGFDGEDRYLVQASDSYTGMGSAFTLLNEMERRGFDAGMAPAFAGLVRPARVMHPDEPTAVVTFASGSAIEEVRARPGAIEIASRDIAPERRAEAARARAELVQVLEDAGRDDLLPLVDASVTVLAFTKDPPAEAAPALARLVEIGGPVAIFVEPAPPPT